MHIDSDQQFQTCCVVIPLHTLNLSDIEHKAVLNCISKLRDFHFVFLHRDTLAPNSIKSMLLQHAPKVVSYTFHSVCDAHLESVKAYNKLLLTASFYEIFRNWDYILLFQLDAWILKGNLRYWIEKSYSYVGAPWVRSLGPWSDCPQYGVGNGGLSLRNVRDMIRLFSSPAFRFMPVFSPVEVLRFHNVSHGYSHCPLIMRPLLFCRRLFRVLEESLGRRNTLSYFASAGEQEDILIGIYARLVYPWLRIPSVREAAEFSLDSNPREISNAFGVGVPFGCHAWEKYDKKFYLQNFPDQFG